MQSQQKHQRFCVILMVDTTEVSSGDDFEQSQTKNNTLGRTISMKLTIAVLLLNIYYILRIVIVDRLKKYTHIIMSQCLQCSYNYYQV